MIKVLAEIKLYNSENSRKTPFTNGYRPLFNFIPNMKTSGSIELINNDNFFYPGEKKQVRISFQNVNFLDSDFKVGKKFTFGEGIIDLGEGVILEIF